MTRNTDIHVTGHAVSRYRERVEAVTFDVAMARLSSPTIRKAIEIGCPSVKLPGGQRVIIEGNSIVTVHPRLRAKRRRYGRREQDDG